MMAASQLLDFVVMHDCCPALMTPPEIAEYLDVGEEEVALWFRYGQLVADARNESGQPLAYRWRVKRDGPGLAAGERVRISRRSRLPARKLRAEILIDPPALPCGCSIDPDIRRPFFLCADARALQSAERLAEAFALAAPDDPFFRRLADVTREAFERHMPIPLNGMRLRRPVATAGNRWCAAKPL
jgi:hypothetical protein